MEEGGVVHLPPLTLGHVRALVLKRTRLPPLISEGCSIPRVHLRGVHGCFLVDISLGGGLLGCRRGGGGVSWGPRLPVTLRGCCGLSLPLGLGLRWRARLGLGASLRLGTPLSPTLRGLLGSRLAGAHLSGPLDPCRATARLSLWEEELAEGPVEAVVSLVWVVLVDVTEGVGPQVGIRDMRAGIAGAGSVSPGGGGILGTALCDVVAVAWEWGSIVGLRPCSTAVGVHIGGGSSGPPNIGIGYVIPCWK